VAQRIVPVKPDLALGEQHHTTNICRCPSAMSGYGGLIRFPHQSGSPRARGVNNAGYGLHGDLLETPIERTVDMIQLNITAKPRPVAASGITALSKVRAMVVAGLANNMVAFSNRLTPRSMQRATLRKNVGP